jgi:hypothetical protein
MSEVIAKGVDPKPGVVHASIDNTSTDKNGNIHFGVTVYGENGHEAAGNPFAPGGWIEMHFEFMVDPKGTVVLVGGTSKTYPSISVFSYSSDGKSKDLFEQKESGNPDDLNKPQQNIMQGIFTPSNNGDDDAQRQCHQGNSAACD